MHKNQAEKMQKKQTNQNQTGGNSLCTAVRWGETPGEPAREDARPTKQPSINTNMKLKTSLLNIGKTLSQMFFRLSP
jgi:hypothetical protein